MLAQTPQTIVTELLPFFFNNRARVNSFLSEVNNKKAVEVTQKVNNYVKNGYINKALKKGSLFQILHDYGIYKKEISNWNQQVDF